MENEIKKEGIIEKRYRLSGTIKFSDDNFVFDNEGQAEEYFKDIYLEIGGCRVLGELELVDKKIEDLGPAHWDPEAGIVMD